MATAPHVDAVPKSIASRKINGMRPVVIPKGKSVIDRATVRRQSVQELWLQGHRAPEISAELDCSVSTVIADIKSFRKELYENNQASLQEHTEQTVAVLRKVEAHLWDIFLSEGISPMQQSRLLEQIRRTEESVAKARGILQSRIIADVVHQVKLYDFKDNFPAPIQNSTAPVLQEATTVDGDTFTVNTQDQNPDYTVPGISEETPSYRGKPDFEEPEGTVLMPDGTWIPVP